MPLTLSEAVFATSFCIKNQKTSISQLLQNQKRLKIFSIENAYLSANAFAWLTSVLGKRCWRFQLFAQATLKAPLSLCTITAGEQLKMMFYVAILPSTLSSTIQ